MNTFKRAFAALSLLGCLVIVPAQAIDPRAQSVELSAIVQVSPPQIKLQWPVDTNASTYTISRKAFSDSAWTPLNTLSGTATQYVDANVAVGSSYEYQIFKTNSFGWFASGYGWCGINAPAIESRGTLILLVDSTWKDTLAAELKRLQQDLAGDGWTVIRQDVARTAPVPSVKALIQSIYSQDPANVKALFLFGHIPVPYSGDFYPDGHPNHRGAWPADAYYGDMDGVWTDSAVTSTTAEKSWNWNVPGDGKFDQSEIPSDIELEVGRVDLSNLTCFSNKIPSRDEPTLLRQYLNKNHNFRNGLLPVQRRGLVCDNFEPDSEALTATGWRNFAAFFGADKNIQIPGGTFFSTLDSQDYLWAFGTGGGGYYTCAGIGGSDDFALNDIKAVFTSFFGSYFGDWDNESNFLRAPLGSSSYTLVSIWGARPPWFMQHMALGETIGFATRLTQNDSGTGLYQPTVFGTREVHTALMGDPTLRLHPVIPVSNVSATPSSPGVSLAWTPSTDEMIQGYNIYRGSSESGPFSKISGNSPIVSQSFNDGAGAASSVYMVRAVKLETSGSGTYYNLSEGALARPYSPPAAPGNLVASASSSAVALAWQDLSSDETGFSVYRKTGGAVQYTILAKLSAGAQSYTDSAVTSGTTYTYAVAAFNAAGQSDFSNDSTVTIPGATAVTFVRQDQATGGSWQGVYGRDGYNIVDNTYSYPAYVNVALSGQSDWTWNSITSDADALQRATDNTRIAACWYANSSFNIQLSFADSQVHRVALYCLDWDVNGRQETIDVIGSDGVSILSSKTISSFQNGVYLVWDLQGRITFRVRALSGNAVVSGLFFDPALEPVLSPVFNPAAGTFTNSVTVSISDSTPGATIHYTLDGSNPSEASPAYSAPLVFTNTTTLRALASKTGMSDSTPVAAAYTVITPAGPTSAQVTFNGVNTTRAGAWKGNIGLQGYSIVSDSQSLPSYVAITPSGKSDWTWEYSTTDTRALQRSSLNSRLATCWYASDSFDVDFNFTDNGTHRLSIYCLDWDFGGREQKVQIVDYATRQVMHEYDLKSFAGGVYLDYNITGRVIARFIKVSSYNAVLSGIFFDAPAP